MNKEELFEYMNLGIVALNAMYDRAIELNLEDTQEFLDWLDKLNEISVRK